MMDCPEDGTTPFVPHGIGFHALHSLDGVCLDGRVSVYGSVSECACTCVCVIFFFLIYVAER